MPRNFDEKALGNYKKEEIFQYDRVVPPLELSLWERFKRWLAELFFKSVSTRENLTVWEYVIYTFFILVIIYAILRLWGINVTNLFYKRPPSNELSFEMIQDNIHELDMDKLIQEAIQNKNFTRAVRLLYLKSLKLLSNKAFIHWQIDKTNYDYIMELKHQNHLIPGFRNVTLLFEYICYGDFPIQDTAFKQAEDTFKNFYKEVEKTI